MTARPTTGGAGERARYVELHCHSTFSLLDGASSPEALVARAKALGHPALALTDHDDLGGLVRFAGAAKEAGIAGILGVELTVEVPGEAPMREAGAAAEEMRGPRLHQDDDGPFGDRPDIGVGGGAPRARARAIPDAPPPADPDAPRRTHLVLLAESREGYGNLATLVTRARMDRPRGRPGVPLDVLARHAGGLYALTGCPRGWVPGLLAAPGAAPAAAERAARAALGTLAEIFDGRVAVECWDHGLAEERALVPRLVRLAREVGLPWVPTTDAHYARAAGRVTHDVLCAIRAGRPLDAMGTRLRPSGEWHLQGAARVRRRWAASHGEALADEGLRATLAVAERCTFRLEDLHPSLPAFPLPPGVSEDEYLARLVEQGAQERWGAVGSHAGTPAAHAAQAAHAPARTPAHDRQIAHELAVIRGLGLAGYFLIVWDLVRFARREGILCQGRGSAANSVVCYCLGITAVDPVRMGLLFERFLSEDRTEPPDIDIDFAHRERERVLQYVYARYGREHAAMVCEHITYRGRSAVRDAARVLGFSIEQANALSLLSDRFSARATAERLRAGIDGAADAPAAADAAAAASLGSAMVRGTEATTKARAVKAAARRLTSADRPAPSAAYEPYGSPAARTPAATGAAAIFDPHAPDTHTERRNPTTALGPAAGVVPGAEAADVLLARAGLDPADRRVRALVEVVDGLHQAPRHRSIHVGGFVLTREPLHTVVPIEPAAMQDRTVIQWEKDDLDPVGLVKIDLLGLGMLTLLQDCLKYVRRTRGASIDLGQLDLADQAVYDDLCRADTIGVFQVESRAQMNTLPRLKPRQFYDLVVEVALIRPGPIQGDMVHPYLRRRAGEEKVEYPHPSLEPILQRTLGVPLFQEQGMKVAIAAAGFTPGEADELRRAMGHKRSRERMHEICERLVAGMARNGIDEETARRIYNQINAFADYGFPESHAASFALLVYASAYLKHYYAPEFTAAILNAQPMGFYAPGTLVEDARRHGVEVRPVSLRASDWDTTLEQSRPDEAPAVRLGLRFVRGLGAGARRKLEAARQAGPFASVADVVRRAGLDRRALRHLAEAGAFDAFFAHEPNDRRRRAALWAVLAELRGEAGPLAPAVGPPPGAPDAPPAPVPAMGMHELTEADYRMTGIPFNGHPLRHLRPLLGANDIRTARELHARGRDGERVGVAGLVICRQRPGTAKGFVFLSLEDETGIVNVVVTPGRFERQATLLSTEPLLLVRGILQVEQTVVNVRGARFEPLRAELGAEHAKRHDFH